MLLTIFLFITRRSGQFFFLQSLDIMLPHNNASNPANKPAATGTLREFPAPALELEFPEDVLEFEPAVEFEVAPEV